MSMWRQGMKNRRVNLQQIAWKAMMEVSAT